MDGFGDIQLGLFRLKICREISRDGRHVIDAAPKGHCNVKVTQGPSLWYSGGWEGGLYLNNNRVDSESKRIEAADIVDGKVLLLSAGKKNKVLVRIA